MNRRSLNVLLYLMSILFFVGFVFVVQIFIFDRVLAAELFTGARVWQTGLPIALLLSYNYYALPHAALAMLAFSLVEDVGTFSLGTIFLIVVSQVLLGLLWVQIAIRCLHLNMRNPSLMEILKYYVWFLSFIFAIFWITVIVRLIFREELPPIFPALVQRIATGTFTYALLIPWFLSIVVPLLDHLLVNCFNVFDQQLRQLSFGRSHSCWYCQPPKKLSLLVVLFVFTICIVGLLYWFSTFGPSWYVVSAFIAFFYIPGGYFFAVFFGLAIFISTVLTLAIFDFVPTDSLSLTLFIVTDTLLILFAARYADHVKEQKRQSERELQVLVDQRTASLRQSQRELITSLDSKRAFISQISHELVTPLHQTSVAITGLSSLSMNHQQLKQVTAARSAHFVLSKKVDDLVVSASLEQSMSPTLTTTTFYKIIDEIAGDFRDARIYINFFEEPCSHEIIHVSIDVLKYSKILELIVRSFFTEVEQTMSPESIMFVHVFFTTSKPLDLSLTNYYFQFMAFVTDYSQVNKEDVAVLPSREVSPVLIQLLEAIDAHLIITNEGINWTGSCQLESVHQLSELFPDLTHKFDSFSIHSGNERLLDYIKCIVEPLLTFTEEPLTNERHLYVVDRVHIHSVVDGSVFPVSQCIILSQQARMNTIGLPVTPLKLAKTISNLLKGSIEVEAPNYPQVLVVDDTKMNVTLLQGMLKKLDVLSDAAFDGEQAIEVFGERLRDDSKDSYKLVIMDILMPKLDGIEATKAIRNLERATSHENTMASVIVALSAHALNDDKSVREMNTVGFDLMIKKPISLERLKQCLYEAGVRCS
ncbi:hypothetical protein RCL1_001111 [Eukaryota sp. TZLM3-RCL]